MSDLPTKKIKFKQTFSIRKNVILILTRLPFKKHHVDWLFQQKMRVTFMMFLKLHTLYFECTIFCYFHPLRSGAGIPSAFKYSSKLSQLSNFHVPIKFSIFLFFYLLDLKTKWKIKQQQLSGLIITFGIKGWHVELWLLAAT